MLFRPDARNAVKELSIYSMHTIRSRRGALEGEIQKNQYSHAYLFTIHEMPICWTKTDFYYAFIIILKLFKVCIH